jgi:ATP-dependent Lon protease
VLSTENSHDRIKKALVIVKSGLETARIQRNIQENLDEQTPNQRKYVLEEQLKLIQKELGVDSDDRNNLIQKFEERLKGKTLSKDAENAFREESNKLKTLETSSAEFNVTRNYLDWMSILPWGVFGEEKFNISKSKKILDRDHYGMQKVKERILEFIAVGKLKKTVQGKIICFVGPPGKYFVG